MNPPLVYTCSPSWTPSLPCTIPLGHPSAPAPSIQFHTSNLDWQFVSYMILYKFQCHSSKSSHPLPLPQSPKDCSIHLCLFCCLEYRVIVTIRVFSNESLLCIRWPNVWSFSFSISPFNEYSGLISFRMDCLDLLALQGTQEPSPTPQFKSINSSAFSLLYDPTLISIHDYWKNHRFDFS